METKVDLLDLEECGCCGCFHRPDWYGDCRNDKERFAYPEALQEMIGTPIGKPVFYNY